MPSTPSWATELLRAYAVTPAEALLRVAVAGLLAWLVALLVERLVSRWGRAGLAPLARRVTFWLITSVGVMAALDRLGVDLSVLMGAAGVLTVAVGFATQTSASNLVSGLFLAAEGSLAVGDLVDIEGTEGEIVSIDLLSVQLRTWDNRLARIPHEALAGSRILNLSRLPLRRVDLALSVHHDADLDRVETLLITLASADPRVLQEPSTWFRVVSIEEGAVRIKFSAWATQEHWLDLRSDLLRQVVSTFRAEGVALAVPLRRIEHP